MRRPGLLALRVLQSDGLGPSLEPPELDLEVQETMREVFVEALAGDGPVYRFVRPAATGQALVVDGGVAVTG